MEQTYPGNGTQRRFTAPFPFLERAHVFVTVNNAPSPYQWVSQTDVEFETAPANGATVRLFRITPDTVGFASISDGSNLTAEQLNKLRLQLLYLIQERSASLGDVAGAFNAVTNDLEYIGDTRSQVDAALATLTGNLATLNALNNRVTVVENTANAAVADLASEVNRALAAEGALASRVTQTEAQIGSFGASVTNVDIARINGDAALASQITSVDAAYKAADTNLQGLINTESTARANGDNANATQITTLQAVVGADAAGAVNIVRNEEFDTTVTDAAMQWASTRVLARTAGGVPSGAPSNRVFRLNATEIEVAPVRGGNGPAGRFIPVQPGEVFDVSIWIGRTAATSGNVGVSVNFYAAADYGTYISVGEVGRDANFTGWRRVDGTVTAPNNALFAVFLLSSGNASGSTFFARPVWTRRAATGAIAIAQIQQESSVNASRFGGLEAQWSVKAITTRSDGKPVIAGIGLASTANNNVSSSEVILQADRLLFVPSGSPNTTPDPLFAAGNVNGTPTFVFNSSRSGDQSVPARVLVDGSVIASKVAAGAITATKVHVHNRDDVMPDPGFRDFSWWGFGSDSNFIGLDQSGSQPVERFCRVNGGMGTARDYFSSKVPVESGQARYRARFHLYISPDATGWFSPTIHVPAVAWYAPWPAQTNVIPGDSSFPAINLATTSIPKGAWVSYEGALPAFATTFQRTEFRTRAQIGNGFVEFAWEVTRMVDAALVVDGAVTAQKLRIGQGGKNLVQNSGPNRENPTLHWGVGWTGNSGLTLNWSGAPDPWRPPGQGGLMVFWSGNPPVNSTLGMLFYCHHLNTVPANAAEHLNLIRIEPGRRYEASCWISAHRCAAWIAVRFYDGTGGLLTEVNPAGPIDNNQDIGFTNFGNNWSGTDLLNGQVPRYGGFVTAPANAHLATIVLYASSPSSLPNRLDPFAFFSQFYFGEATLNQRDLSPWSPGAPNTTIIGDMIKTGTIQASRLSVSQLSAITANIGLLRTASSGARMEIENNVQRVFDSSGNLRVRLGSLV